MGQFDDAKQKWDVKSPWSTPPGNGKGAFDLDTTIKKMDREFARDGNNFILDRRNLTDSDVQDLRRALDNGNNQYKVEWYPPLN